ncbi:hypothetical protein SAMN02910264_02141 [Ruminococcaceae bacterium YAD3003]|nr:hypothetical protein SAMN02910264_02141 [Ruminococcaceae bacterium YAD3003]
MQLGWVDYSKEDRDNVLQLLKKIKDTETIDALGIGIIRDAISDVLYPATSTQHTRAKYLILIPELFTDAMQNYDLTTGAEVRNYINRKQDDIARKLRELIELDISQDMTGIIGVTSEEGVKLKPTNRYWNALRELGILSNPRMSFYDACHVVAENNINSRNIEIKYEDKGLGGDDNDANNKFIIFEAPPQISIKEFLKKPTLKLSKSEASFLKERYLSMPGSKDSLMGFCLEKSLSYKDTALKDVDTESMSGNLKRSLSLANELSEFMYGAYIVYNIAYFKNGGENATDTQKNKLNEEYALWKKSFKCLIHREEILSWVKNNNKYCYELRSFIKDFEESVNNNKYNVCSPDEIRIITKREKDYKKSGSKIGKDITYKETQLRRMEYRHSNAQTIITDILEGLK